MPGRLGDLEMAVHLIELLARGELAVALVELADDLFRRCAAGACWSCPCCSSASESHNDWTATRASPQPYQVRPNDRLVLPARSSRPRDRGLHVDVIEVPSDGTVRV